jgi:dCMP deaminase
MRTALVAYIPVLHKGYIEMLERADISAVYIISHTLLEELPDEFDYLRRKDAIRAVPEEVMLSALRGIVHRGVRLHVANSLTCHDIALSFRHVLMPDEDISYALAQRYFSGVEVEYGAVFLRYDRTAVLKEEAAAKIAERSVSLTVLDRIFMGQAHKQAEKSADWWRQVGAVLVKDEQLIYTARNDHTPYPQAPNAFGDPRSIFKRGVKLEWSTAEHAEAVLIAEAAKHGVSTKGASLYVTTFPCPICARLVARAGIKRCYFATGYAVLDGADEMRRHNVELIEAKI